METTPIKPDFDLSIYQKGYIPPDIKFVHTAIDLIEKHFKERRDPDFYLDKLKCGEWRANKILTRYMKHTLYELIQLRVHQEAVALLSSTILSIKEITYELGLNDQSYFSKCFTRITGLSPSEWRRQTVLDQHEI